MGKDKYENEELIKYGLPLDIWFHVDGLSSAHVYLRCPSESETDIDDIPKDVLEECMQIVKHNSIEGCKLKSVKICYTYWSNLVKNINMEVGQVGHKSNKDMRYSYVEKNRDIIKELNKTLEEKNVDLEGENAKYYKDIIVKRKKEYEEQRKKKAIDNEIKKAELSDKRFEYLHNNNNINITTNKNAGKDDDFM